MKKLVTPKKLTLSRETVGKLTAEQAKAALGGQVYTTLQPELPWTSDSVKACCA
jgi:hypothetical protein